MVQFELTKTQMIFVKFWLFGELKTELQPQSPGGVGPAGPRRLLRACPQFFFFGISKVAKNNEFTWVLRKTRQNGYAAASKKHLWGPWWTPPSPLRVKGCLNLNLV